MTTVCAASSCEQPALMTCGGCGSVKYCCRQCQAESWENHRIVCKKILAIATCVFKEVGDQCKPDDATDLSITIKSARFDLPRWITCEVASSNGTGKMTLTSDVFSCTKTYTGDVDAKKRKIQLPCTDVPVIVLTKMT